MTSPPQPRPAVSLASSSSTKNLKNLTSTAHALLTTMKEQEKLTPGVHLPYDHERVDSVVREINSIFSLFSKLTSQKTQQEQTQDMQDSSKSALLVYLKTCALRDKRCVLAYLNKRLLELFRYRWEESSVLNSHFEIFSNSIEKSTFKEYNKHIYQYMSSIGPDGLDLTIHFDPPNQLFKEVRGSVPGSHQVTCFSGETYQISDRSTILLPIDDAEYLLKDNLVEEM